MSKRSADEILPGVTPLSAALLSSMTVEQEAKKAKLDAGAAYVQMATSFLAGRAVNIHKSPSALSAPPPPAEVSPSQPSRVVHLRNLASDMLEMELLHLCQQHGGRVSKYMMLKGKNQAFVEYEDEKSAASIVSSLNTNPIQIRGRTVFIQYSMHQEIRMSERRRDADNSELSSTASQLDISSGTQQLPNSVLRVIIENMLYPVTLDILHSVFARYGKVLRIITFNKNNTFQALVQLSEAQSAQAAKAALENHNVYNGCCTLRIDYSKLATLNVKYNNDKSRDYTNPNLPSGELTVEQQLSIAAAAGQGSMHSLLTSPFLPFSANPAVSAMLANQQHNAAAAAALANSSDFALLGGNGGADGGGGGVAQFLPTALTNLGHVSLPSSAALSPHLRFSVLAPTPVVLVSNLDEINVNPDALFTLFGVYGDVIRVKILFNKKDNALIQYSEPAQALLAVQHLDRVRWHDKLLRVAPSKHVSVQMPKEGQPDAGLTRDYSHSTLHRFKKPGSKNYMNIYPPSSTLHLSNIPPSTTEQQLLEAFDSAGYAAKAFKFFPKDHKMALLQLEDIHTAIQALILMHNHKLAENAHLRVSFSKSAI